MIPFLQWTTIELGPLTIQVWGLFVALGIAAGLGVAVWATKQRGLKADVMMDVGFWIIVGAMLVARLFYVVTEWSQFGSDPIEILRVWHGGLSMSGGLLGAALAGWLRLRMRHEPVWPYVEMAAFGLPLGIWLGRLGCFFIFDHPGSPTNFVLGQLYRDGIVRHNHGLYLSIDGFLLTLLFAWLWHRQPRRPVGFYIMLYLLWDGIVRLVLDVWRAHDLVGSDSRWLGLTAAQYIALAMLAVAARLWYYLYHETHHPPHTQS